MRNRRPGAGIRRGLRPGVQGYARWIAGRLERGPFGGAKRLGKPRWQVDAFRCPRCAHLELFAATQI
ncbi:hypothetical protein [Virgisporangium aurantiacum]|uniref:hypothetical protein n=1 Tax=Virgisporangium aurantiacum TaxID=175570 RepID=UPI00194F6BE4|nr:hypothetical protein [Virgisporangium aurantiacum]